MIVLSHQNIVEAGCFDIKLAIETIEKALVSYTRGEILLPDKVSQIFDEATQERINCLPATLLKEKVCGMKWVAVFPPNPVKRGLPNLNASILLSEIETGYPIAFMDATLCSDMRTAAIGAIAAKHLSLPNASSIGIIGSGEQAKMTFLAMKAVRPSITQCRVASRRPESEQAFVDAMQPLFPDVQFTPCNADYERSATGADIVVTAISAQLPLLQAAWLKPGAFYNHVGGWEDAYDVPLSVDKIVCDCWENVKHRTQTISRLYKAGKLHDEDIYADLPDIVAGNKPGRESDTEKIYFNAVGLAYADIALANAVYNRAAQHPASATLEFHKQSVFSCPQELIKR